jgi:hypothetical protein
MSTPVDVLVRYNAGAYIASAAGKRASSTMDASMAAERLADKLFGPGATASSLPAVPGDACAVHRFRLTPGRS